MAVAPGMDDAMLVISVISIIICAFTIFLYYKYPRMQQKSLYTVVNYMCFCCIFTSIGIALGLPRNGTFKCYLQAFLTNVFPLATIFWTTTIAYMVFGIIYRSRKIDIHSKPVLALTFILPVILTLLPLSTETFGSPQDKDDWCFVRERASSNAPEWTTMFWSMFCFYAWIFLTALIYLVLIFITIRHVYKLRGLVEGSSVTLDKMEASLFKLIWYPLISLIVWGPAAVYDFAELYHATSGQFSGNFLEYVAYLFPGLHGILICIAFFATNTDVRVILVELCGGRGLPNEQLLENLLCQNTSYTGRSSSGTNGGLSARDTGVSCVTRDTGISQLSFAIESPSVVGKSSHSIANKKQPTMKNPLGWTGDAVDENIDATADVGDDDYSYV